jgi:membrane-associated PAP2 superfamily phosphatase
LPVKRVGRAGLFIVLLVGGGAGLAFGLFPILDLWGAQAFYDASSANHHVLALRTAPAATIVRRIGFWVETVLVVLPVMALGIKLVMPRTKMLMSGSAIVFLTTSLALAPGLVTNVALKEYWGRPRPGHIVQFGGSQHFVAWWDPRGDCQKNCSFVSGEASAAFWTLAPAALVPPASRALAYAAALSFGIIVSWARMMTGGHFLSDTIFAGVLTFLVIWLLYALIFRWQRTRLDDGAIETALERLSISWHAALKSLGQRSADQSGVLTDGDQRVGRGQRRNAA